jgi:hypothetical protein
MLDHALGRPSPGFKRIQVLITTLIAIYYLKSSSKKPNSLFALINKFCRYWPPWKIVLSTVTLSYLAKNFMLMMFLNAPEPFSRMYTRNFFRATWYIHLTQAAVGNGRRFLYSNEHQTEMAA